MSPESLGVVLLIALVLFAEVRQFSRSKKIREDIGVVSNRR